MNMIYSVSTRNRRWIAGATAAGLVALASSRDALAASVPGLITAYPHSLQGSQALDHYTFAHDCILGTSLDLTVSAPHARDAEECKRQILIEIERLRAILSTYDPSSEISRVKSGADIESIELAELLNAYALWNARSGGAIDVNMSEVIRLWKLAASENEMPSTDAIRAARTARLALNVDALGKGYIIDRAVELARQFAPAGLLNIGGDIRAWGDAAWLIGVADPRNPAENAPLLRQFTLRDAAVATSGGYARFFSIGGQRYSHIIDPRTGLPVVQVTSASAIADDCLTANAISTAASVMGMEEGANLAELFGKGHLIVADSGEMLHGGALALADTNGTPMPSGASATSKPSADSGAWAKDFQVTVKVAIKPNTGVPGGGPGRGPMPGGPGRGGGGRRGGGAGNRPYVAVWIQDANDKVIKTIALLGNNPRYMPELSYYWHAVDADSRGIRATTRATRPAGEYTVVWDGKDEFGKLVPKGVYTVVLEVNREHGRHIRELVDVTCDDTPKTLTINETAETDPSSVEYAQKKTDNISASVGSPLSDAN